MGTDSKKRTANLVWLALSAAGIGVLMGITSSPVAGIAVTSLLGIAVAVTTVLAGIDPARLKVDHVTTLPLLIVVLFILFGLWGGVSLRIRRAHPPQPSLDSTITGWALRTGWSDTTVARRIFERTKFDAFDATVPEVQEVRTTTMPADLCSLKGGEVVTYDSTGVRRVPLVTYCDSLKRLQQKR